MVYQRYLGWYDSNPTNLNKLSPVEAAQRYVKYMSGANAVIEKAKKSCFKQTLGRQQRWEERPFFQGFPGLPSFATGTWALP
jgi:alkyl sulfatase BDS1-like metallo-beta-lactamase superfamily hydrolase